MLIPIQTRLEEEQLEQLRQIVRSRGGRPDWSVARLIRGGVALLLLKMEQDGLAETPANQLRRLTKPQDPIWKMSDAEARAEGRRWLDDGEVKMDSRAASAILSALKQGESG